MCVLGGSLIFKVRKPRGETGYNSRFCTQLLCSLNNLVLTVFLFSRLLCISMKSTFVSISHLIEIVMFSVVYFLEARARKKT